MNLKYSLLLLVIACCAIDTNCSSSNGQYNINYNNIDTGTLNKLGKLVGEKYTDTNSLSDICDIFLSKLSHINYEVNDSPLYGPLKLLQPISKRTNRNRAFIIGPTILLLLLDPTMVTPFAFLESNLWNSICIRNVNGVDSAIEENTISSKFFNEYDDFANAVYKFANEHSINFNKANQVLQQKWKNSSKFRNTFGVIMKDFINTIDNYQFFTSVKFIEKYVKVKSILEKYLVEFVEQIDNYIDDDNIYNDYTCKIVEEYYMFVKNMYKQINNIKNNMNITDEELQKIWATIIVRHIYKINGKLYKMQQNFSKNHYILKNFYEIFPLLRLHDIEEYVQKKL